VQRIPELTKHAELIDDLGCGGMSSDETSVEHGVKLFRIKKKFWRAAELGPFLHAIDRVTERIQNTTTSRGSSKYHRLPGENESREGGIVSGLPINLYDPVWLANLRANMKPAYDMLEVKPDAYPLVHDPIIQE
jgi:hypothetical protein